MQAHIQEKKKKSHRHEVTKWVLRTQNHGINATFLPTAAEHRHIVVFFLRFSLKRRHTKQVCQRRRLGNLKSESDWAWKNRSPATLDSTFQDCQQLLRMFLLHLPAPEENSSASAVTLHQRTFGKGCKMRDLIDNNPWAGPVLHHASCGLPEQVHDCGQQKHAEPGRK